MGPEPWSPNYLQDFPGGSDSKASVYNAGDLGLIPGSGRFPGEGNGNPLQCSCLENPMEGGAWQASAVHGVAKSRAWLSNFTFFPENYEQIRKTKGCPGNLDSKESACKGRRPEFNPWVGKLPWRREWLPIPIFLPEESHGQKSLAGYSSQGHKESDMTEQPTQTRKRTYQ